jgi:hypothetical protein
LYASASRSARNSPLRATIFFSFLILFFLGVSAVLLFPFFSLFFRRFFYALQEKNG